jgi:hypothetical protein
MNAQSTAKPPRVPPERTLRFATALEDLDAFVEAFSQLVDDRSLFIVTRHPLKVGLICQFVVTLRDGTPVLRGEGEVLESPATLSQTSPVTGIRIRVQRLSPSSVELYQRLLERKRLHEISVVESLPTREMQRPPPPPPSKAKPESAPIVEERAPSSPYVLPANPLSELTDRALHGMIECAIHEDYENAPPSDFADLMTPPPGMTRGRRPTTQAAALLPAPEPAPAPVVAPEPIVVTAPAPPPQIIEVPGPPVRISIGVRAQLVTAALAVLVGLGGGFVLFGTDLVWTKLAPPVPNRVVASRSAPPPAAVEPTAAAEPTAAVDAGSIAPDPAADPAAADPAAADPAAADPPVADPPAADPAVAEPAAAEPGAGECSLTLHDMHDGATVSVDGVRVRVPASGVVAAACDRELLVSVEHPRYQLFQRKVTATAGSPAVVDINLQRPEAELTIASDPPGALITLDGNVVGRAPTTADTREFTTVHVTATLAGHKVWSKRIRVSRPSMSVNARLEKLPGAP